jgi:hypothetical protein
MHSAPFAVEPLAFLHYQYAFVNPFQGAILQKEGFLPPPSMPSPPQLLGQTQDCSPSTPPNALCFGAQSLRGIYSKPRPVSTALRAVAGQSTQRRPLRMSLRGPPKAGRGNGSAGSPRRLVGPHYSSRLLRRLPPPRNDDLGVLRGHHTGEAGVLALMIAPYPRDPRISLRSREMHVKMGVSRSV